MKNNLSIIVLLMFLEINCQKFVLLEKLYQVNGLFYVFYGFKFDSIYVCYKFIISLKINLFKFLILNIF